ncbi:hypothetical protein [Streptomyces albidoflavus]|uniref:hypothetical protein n=1 Tax=Streptomyces albidoflavus TaxID=1886 RepID=UPI00101E4324|nr:hypothetical protein [Streptomyces albidoflavus]RZD77680.1 hypothetical protein C0Q63_31250 [Streptomyces albidoflavus]
MHSEGAKVRSRFDGLPADRRTTGQQAWDGALVWSGADPFSHSAVETRSHTWIGISAGTLHLSTKTTAYPPVADPPATRWHAADAETRCDKIAAKHGCATYFATR